MANKAFVEKNPAAAKLFEVMSLPIGDISQQNRLMREGQSRQQDVERHTDTWIKAHQKTFDGWIQAALKAAGS
ncbi:Glycine betaine-binding periplasmic protein precursor [compost metagenome]